MVYNQTASICVSLIQNGESLRLHSAIALASYLSYITTVFTSPVLYLQKNYLSLNFHMAIFLHIIRTYCRGKSKIVRCLGCVPVTPHLFFVRLMTVCPSIAEDLCLRFHVLKDKAFANLRVSYNKHRCDGKLRMYSTKTNDYLPLFVVTKVSFKLI